MNSPCTRQSRAAAQQGGIGMRMCILAATLLMLGLALVWILGKFQEDQKRDHRKAVAIAEYGLQNAMMQLSENPNWEGNVRTEYDGGWYTAHVSRRQHNDSLVLTVTTEGHSGRVASKKSYVVAIPRP